MGAAAMVVSDIMKRELIKMIGGCMRIGNLEFGIGYLNELWFLVGQVQHWFCIGGVVFLHLL